MSFSIGIVGLPNVGKSTLFNALTNLNVEAANYPFATIDPNTGIVPVPDERLDKLAKLENSAEIIPTVIEFVDIAGLVAGAHKGEGLGNKFLSHIREVDAILEVVRVFENDDITHVAGAIDPGSDIETIQTELVLADLQMIEKKLDSLESAARGGKKEDVIKFALTKKYMEVLSAGKSASSVTPTDEEKKYSHEFPLLTRKPMLYVANVNFGEGSPSPQVWGEAGREVEVITIDAKLEAEISQLPESERDEYLKELGLKESGLDKIIRESYALLDLITFFTAGPKETRAWTCKKGTKAPKAAGIIHTDFEQGFIRAEVINTEKLLQSGGWNQAKEKGLLRTEGKEYVIQDGDVVHFRFSK